MFRSRNEQSPIGLDVGEPGARWVRAAQAVGGRGSAAQPVRLGRLSRGSTEELTPGRIACMMDALERQGFVGRRVVLHLPQKKVLSAVLDVPPRNSGAPLDVICRNELARTHRLEPDAIESGWWELPAPAASAGSAAASAGPQVVAVGCRSRDAEELIALFDEADATVCGIESRSAALARGARLAASPGPELSAIVEWECAAALVVVVRGESILYERHLPEAGLAALRVDIERKLAVDAAAASYLVEQLGLGQAGPELAEESELVSHAQRLIIEQLDSMVLEVRASATYASRRFGDSVSRIIFAGAGADIPGVAERMQARAEIPVASHDRNGGDVQGGHLAALGLAAMPAEVLA